MTFKDLIRLIRRRWLVAALTFALVVAGFAALSFTTDRTLYRASTRVEIKTPPILIANKGSQFITIEQTTMDTWLTHLRGPGIREEARRALQKKEGYREEGAVRDEWFSSIRIERVASTQIVRIEAVASSRRLARDVVEAMADAAAAWSTREANKRINDEKAALGARRLDEQAKLQKRLANADAKRRQARRDYGAERLESDVDYFRRTVQEHDTRRRELVRKISAVDHQLVRIKRDRTETEHLSRETLPRLGRASLQARVEENPDVQRLRERLETELTELRDVVKRYTDAHPQVKGLRSDIRETKLALTRATVAAVGRDIDREEISLRTDRELSQIEAGIIVRDLVELRKELSGLSTLLKEAQKEEAEAARHQEEIDRLGLRLEQMGASVQTGYIVRLIEPTTFDSVQAGLRQSWYVAVMAGIVFAIGFAFLMEFLDTSLRNDYDVRRHLDYPVLTVVPKVAADEVITIDAGRAAIMTEIYDTLATVMQSLPTESTSRVFVVTSTNPQEGKTAASTNLAIALARQGRRTLLVDGDMRVPAIHTVLGLPNETGLSDLLLVQMSLAGTEGLLQDTPVPNLRVLTSGMAPENPYELLDASRVSPVAAQFRENFDAIVIDTPPILRTGDALKLATLADAVLFVVEAGRTEQRQATWAKRLLTNVNARVAGVLLTRAASESEEYYYYYDRSHGSRGPKAHRRA